MVLCIYRAPTENLKQFYNLLEKTLNHLLQLNTTYLICGDLNINFSIRSKDTLKLETLMNTFNLTQAVDFPTRITNNNGTLIDTIFVDTSLYDKNPCQATYKWSIRSRCPTYLFTKRYGWTSAICP